MSIDLLHELVRHYSPSEQEDSAVQYLVNWMREHRFEAWRDDAGNACGMRGAPTAAHTLILLGHIDTVSGYINPRIDGDMLFGRGSVDAKGPLAAFASAVANAAIPHNWRVIVVGAVEEESASSKGARFIRDCYTPDLCVIGEPSGAANVTLGYKGRLLVNYSVVRPRGHSARPEPTVGAVAAEFWQRTLGWVNLANQGSERYFDQVMPTLLSINTESDSFNERAEAVVGFRLPPAYSPDAVQEVISGIADEDAIVAFSGKEAAFRCEKDSPLARQMISAIRATGMRPNFVLKTGTSDMNVVGARWRCPIVAYGPGDSSLDHTPNEHISLSEYEQAIKVLTHFIETL